MDKYILESYRECFLFSYKRMLLHILPEAFSTWLFCLYVVNSVMCHPDPLLDINYLSENWACSYKKAVSLLRRQVTHDHNRIVSRQRNRWFNLFHIWIWGMRRYIQHSVCKYKALHSSLILVRLCAPHVSVGGKTESIQMQVVSENQVSFCFFCQVPGILFALWRNLIMQRLRNIT